MCDISSISLQNRHRPVPASDWALYRPEEPGNSPIYVAKDSLQDGGGDVVENAFQIFKAETTTTKRPSTTSPSRRPLLPKRRDSASSDTYDPFNPSTYTRAFSRRKGVAAVRLGELTESSGNSPFYFPNYIPS